MQERSGPRGAHCHLTERENCPAHRRAMPSIRNDHHLRVLLNGVICKIPLFQRDPPLHKIRIPLPLPSAEPPGLLIGRAGDEYSYIIIGCKAGVMAVASLHDDQRSRAEGTRRQIGTFAAGVGPVGECLPARAGTTTSFRRRRMSMLAQGMLSQPVTRRDGGR